MRGCGKAPFFSFSSIGGLLVCTTHTILVLLVLWNTLIDTLKKQKTFLLN